MGNRKLVHLITLAFDNKNKKENYEKVKIISNFISPGIVYINSRPI